MRIMAVAAMTAFSLGAQTIAVYVRNDASVALSELCQAKSNAAAIFASASVRIEWRKGEPTAAVLEEQRPIVIRIVSDMPSAHPGALAFAQAYEGIHVTILYERVRAVVPERPQLILTYVLVHEITHLLQGISRHSETGIMKAHWNWVDHYAMGRGRLFLSAEDIALIHLGLAARTSQLLVAKYQPPAAR
jgi:hypothetical protein